MARITLSRPRRADIAAMTEALQAPGAAQWLTQLPQPYTATDAEAFVTRHASPDEHAIRVDGAFAGMVRGGPDLGYWLAPAFQGRGIATAAATLALSRRFAAGAGLIGAQVMDGNAPSQAVLARLGFRPVGPVVMESPVHGAVPGMRHHLVLADFAAAQPLHLTTERCEIAPALQADLPDLQAIATLPEVARMLFLFHPGMSAEAFALTHPAWNGLPPFRSTIRQGGRIIGSVGVGLAADALGEGAAGEGRAASKGAADEGGAAQQPASTATGPHDLPPTHHTSAQAAPAPADADALAGRPDALRRLEVYYYFAPQVAGQGLASEVVPAFCNLIAQRFAPPGGLVAEVFDDNPASARVLSRAGFVLGAALPLTSRGRPAPAPGHSFARPPEAPD